MSSPWIKAGRQQQKDEKDQIFMEREELSTQQSLCQGRKRKKIKDFPEFSKNRGTTYPIIQGKMRVVLRGKPIILNAFIKKMQTSHTNILIAHLKDGEEKEANTPKWCRWQEIVKLNVEINEFETKRIIQ